MSLAVSRLLPHECLLVACADTRKVDATRRRIAAALAAPDLDWTAVVRTAVQHGVAALLALHLADFSTEFRIPAPIIDVLDRISAAHAKRNSTLFAAAGRITGALERAGIPTLTLKGVGLAIVAYPNIALRNFADIDLLVPPEFWEQAGIVAAEAGFLPEKATVTSQDYHLSYVSMVSEDILSDCLIPEFEPKHRPEALGDCVHRIVVEIHRSTFNLPGGFARNTPLDALWDNPRTVVLPDQNSIFIPAPEAMITHIAAHAASHRYWRLIFVTDMVQALRTWDAEINWDRLIALARRYAAENAVYRMLEVAHREFAAPVPREVLEQLNPGPMAGPDGKRLEMSEIFAAMEIALKTPSAIRWQQLLCERSPRQALASWLQLVFPSPSSMRSYYHVRSPWILAVCYVIRPFQLIGRLAHVLFWRPNIGRAQRIRTLSAHARDSQSQDTASQAKS